MGSGRGGKEGKGRKDSAMVYNCCKKNRRKYYLQFSNFINVPQSYK